jgi:hypothetical protein
MNWLMRSLLCAAVALLMSISDVFGQSVVTDHAADVSVSRPAFVHGAGPVVAIDAAHHNYHTKDDRFAPFASLLANDGFRVIANGARFSAENLRAIDVLVIANAAGRNNQRLEQHTAVSPHRAGDRSGEVLGRWWRRLVAAGGSSAVRRERGAARAGVRVSLGEWFGSRRQSCSLNLFTIAGGGLKQHPIARGRPVEEGVNGVRSFAGTAFSAPADAAPLIALSKRYVLLACGLPCPENTPERSGEGYLQGATALRGKGRLALFGEAAMFSAQVHPPSGIRFGFNAPGAPQTSNSCSTLCAG